MKQQQINTCLQNLFLYYLSCQFRVVRLDIKMNRLFSYLTVTLLLISCSTKKSTFDQNEKIQKLGTPSKIEYFRQIDGGSFDFSDTATFVITDPNELNSVMNEIRNADNPESWKGAGWDRITVTFSDTILNFYTNIKKIGTSANGTFYDLEKENFITKRLRRKIK